MGREGKAISYIQNHDKTIRSEMEIMKNIYKNLSLVD